MILKEAGQKFKAKSIGSQLRIRVENPLTGLREVTENEYTRTNNESDS